MLLTVHTIVIVVIEQIKQEYGYRSRSVYEWLKFTQEIHGSQWRRCQKLAYEYTATRIRRTSALQPPYHRDSHDAKLIENGIQKGTLLTGWEGTLENLSKRVIKVQERTGFMWEGDLQDQVLTPQRDRGAKGADGRQNICFRGASFPEHDQSIPIRKSRLTIWTERCSVTRERLVFCKALSTVAGQLRERVTNVETDPGGYLTS